MIEQATLDASVNWLAKYEAAYSEAEARGDAIGMAKALDGTLRPKLRSPRATNASGLWTLALSSLCGFPRHHPATAKCER